MQSFRNLVFAFSLTAAFLAPGSPGQAPDPLGEKDDGARAQNAPLFDPSRAPGSSVGPAAAGTSDPAVWTTGSLAKVQPNATPGRDQAVALTAARNEFESFQVHVRAGSAPVQLNVTVSDFIDTRSHQAITADPNVAVFRESYLKVTTVSDLNGIAGLVPDALVPVRDPYFREARNAFPVTIPAGETRSAWVDVFVPPATAAGTYVATATVSNGLVTLASIPVRLKVWNFTLPSAATLKSVFAIGYGGLGFAAYGSYDGVGKYPGSGGNPEVGLARLHAAVATFFLDHRIGIANVVLSPTYPAGEWTQFDSIYGPLITGQAQTLTPGARLTAVAYNNPVRPAVNSVDLADWGAHFTARGWFPYLNVFVCDEPPAGCAWSDIPAASSAIHSVVPGLPVQVTTSIERARNAGVLEAIDILTPWTGFIQPRGGASQRPAYDDWLKLPGKQLWWYQSCSEHGSCANGTPGPTSSTYPSYMADASPVRNRIFQWMAYLYRMQGELYYFTELWGDDPWDHLYSFGGNGDGALYYPGTIDRIGGTTPIPVASMRLKLIRDGMEDFEYLNALAKAGYADLAQQTINSFIQNAYSYNNDPAALASARDQLGTYLHRLSLGLPVR